MEKRVKLLCWHCGREYTLLRELQDKARLFVECPYCERAAVVDLAPYRSEAVEVLAGEESAGEIVVDTLDLPPVLPTALPDEEE